MLIRLWVQPDATSKLPRKTRKFRILSAVAGPPGMPEEDIG